MEKQSRITPQHTWELLLFSVVFTILFSACQQENLISNTNEETQQITLRFSVEDSFETGTEYIPMKNATRAGTNTVKISNTYQLFILEETANGDFMLVDQSQTSYFDKNKPWHDVVDISSGITYDNIVTALRPGNYKIVIFSIPFYSEFRSYNKGEIIPGPGKSAGDFYAIKYTSLFSTFYVLPTEVFYANADLEIKKTTDLYTPNPNEVNLNLTRRSSKFRIAMQETTDADNNGGAGIPYIADLMPLTEAAMTTTFKRVGPEPQFSWGLDMWGKVWYDPAPTENNGHTYLNYLVYLKNLLRSTSYTPFVDNKYFMSTMEGVTSGAAFYFSDPETAIKVENMEIDLAFSQNEHAKYDVTHEFTLENNKITGIVLKLNGQNTNSGKYTYYGTEAVYEIPNLLNPAKLFHGNYEHDY